MKICRRFFLILMLLAPLVMVAQDTADRQRADSGRRWRQGFFTDTSQYNSSDYQVQIEKTFAALDNINRHAVVGNSFDKTAQKLQENDSILAVIQESLESNSRALNLRNLQVFRTLLLHMQEDLSRRRSRLDTAEVQLEQLRLEVRTLIGDTVLRQLQRDSAMVQQFDEQLLDLRNRWRTTRRNLRESLALINRLQTHASSNTLTAVQLVDQLDDLLASANRRIFGKESNYIWEPDSSVLSSSDRSSIRKVVDAERKAVGFYFRDSSGNRLLILVLALLFIGWNFWNIRSLRNANGLSVLKEMKFEYLPGANILGGILIAFSIAPLFDLKAPAAYVESLQFIVIILLTFLWWRKWPKPLFGAWLAMVLFYLTFTFTRHWPDPGTWVRLGMIALNVLTIVFATRIRRGMEEHLPLQKFIRFVILLHNLLQALAIIANLTGRISLAQLLGNTAIFAFMHATSLSVFSRMLMESILLHMVGSRYRRGLTRKADFNPVIKSFGRPILLVVILQWLIVFTTNLNIYTAVYDWVVDFLKEPREIGSASFTFGGIVLFFMIIWLAHLLQKYVGYFFGDAGNDEDIMNKRQRSRLLITKLIVLTLGYLLAVAASGIPVDKITIVLGALGVGIGLGLQNIVSNFVSGIILIFDRPLQIGDIVEIGGQKGKVREIGLRSSIIQTKEGAEVIIPNGDLLSQRIVNWTLSNSMQRLEIAVKIPNLTDLEEAARKAKELVRSSPHVSKQREPQVLFLSMDETGCELKIYYWCNDTSKAEQANSDVLFRVHQAGWEKK